MDKEQKCREAAFRILERGMNTEKQLRDKLKKKMYEEEYLDKVIEFLIRYKFIDDENYARIFIKNKIKINGRKKMKYDLIRKGIAKEIVEKQFEEIDNKNEFKFAIEVGEKKYRGIKKNCLDEYKIKAKLYNHMIMRGYDYEMIGRVYNEIKD